MHGQAIGTDSLDNCSPAQEGQSLRSPPVVEAVAQGTLRPGVYDLVNATLVRRDPSCTCEPQLISV